MTKSVLRKLWRMKWRAIAFSLVVSLATAMLITGLYSAVVFDRSMEDYVNKANFPDIFIELLRPMNISMVEPQLLSDPSIRSYDLRLKMDATYSYDGKTYPAILKGVRDPSRSDISKLTVKTGSLFSGPGKCAVITGMEDIGAKEGGQLDLRIGNDPFSLEVIGTVQSTEHLFAAAVPDTFLPIPGRVVIIYMDLGQLQDITGGGINDIILLLREGSDKGGVVASLKEVPISRVTYQEDHPSVLFMELGAGKMRNMFPTLSVIFMVIGIISIFMTFYRLVMNDSRYIGVMMSMGHSRARIFVAYLTMGLVIASVGFVLGLMLALFFTWGIMSITMEMFGSVELSFPVEPAPFLIGLLFNYGSVLVSVGVPVLLVSRQTVREALDHKPRTRMVTFLSDVPIVPGMDLMALRNTFRNPLRLAFTVLVVGISIGTSGSWVVMSSSALSFINEQIESDTWDIRADLHHPLSNDEALAMVALPDSEFSIPFMVLAGQVRSGDGEGSAFVMACDRMEEAKDLKLSDGKVDLSRAVVTNKLASDRGLDIGDTINLTVGSRSMEIRVSGIVYDILMMMVYLDRNAAAPLIEKDLVSGVFIKLKDKDLVSSAASALMGVPAVSRVTIRDDITKGVQDTFGSSMSLLWTFFFITLLITMVVAASAIIISTMERDVEFATLETLGVPARKVVRSILIEVAIIGTASAAIGVPFAYLLGKVFALVMQEVLYYFPVLFAISTMIMTFSFGLAFVLVSAIFPIRYARSLDMERTIRERTSG